MGEIMDRVTILRDSREKANNGYFWEENDWCEGYEVTGLKSGDYSIKGFEDSLSIERKRSTGELATNVYEKRFERELERLQSYKYSFIICEFSLDDVIKFPIDSGIPPRRWKYLKVTSKFLLKKVAEYQVKFNTKILFCGNKSNAWDMVNSIFKRVIENENKDET